MYIFLCESLFLSLAFYLHLSFCNPFLIFVSYPSLPSILPLPALWIPLPPFFLPPLSPSLPPSYILSLPFESFSQTYMEDAGTRILLGVLPVSIVKTDDGRLLVELSDGSKELFDTVVAAVGTYAHLHGRPILLSLLII